MPIRRRSVYAALFVTSGEILACAESPTYLIRPVTVEAGVSERGDEGTGGAVPLMSNQIWWALVEMQISMLCMVLDCGGQNQPTPAFEGTNESIKDLMREQVQTYWASGLRPGLSEQQVESAKKCVVELLSAMGAAPADLSADLRNDYTLTLECIRDDLSAL